MEENITERTLKEHDISINNPAKQLKWNYLILTNSAGNHIFCQNIKKKLAVQTVESLKECFDIQL